ncbi:MAG: methyltransferase domain-containing protein [Syntrophomonadaceae bacterium]|nr:methyltransferase domain-containing protein [Syntrophomonadaceae bacterium]
MGNSIKDIFDNHAGDYDRQRKQLIPCFEDFYNVSLNLAPLIRKDAKILDIGAGTGLFTWYFLQVIPVARFTLIDVSEKMLKIARYRLRDYEHTRYIADDYINADFDGQYDCIISSLSVHHLPDPEKEALFRKSYRHLLPGGFFINADQVRGRTPYWDRINKTVWKERVEESGLSPAEIAAARERVKLDKEAPLDRQLEWLTQAGFIEVECIYKYFHFAVMVGRKPVE